MVKLRQRSKRKLIETRLLGNPKDTPTESAPVKDFARLLKYTSQIHQLSGREAAFNDLIGS